MLYLIFLDFFPERRDGFVLGCFFDLSLKKLLVASASVRFHLLKARIEDVLVAVNLATFV